MRRRHVTLARYATDVSQMHGRCATETRRGVTHTHVTCATVHRILEYIFIVIVKDT